MHQAQQSEAISQGVYYKRHIACPAIFKRSQKLNRRRHIGAAAHAELGVPESREQVVTASTWTERIYGMQKCIPSICKSYQVFLQVSSAALCLQEQLRPLRKSKKVIFQFRNELDWA